MEDTSIKELKTEIEKYINNPLGINIARGKPGPDQLKLSEELLNKIDIEELQDDQLDYKNYGGPLGIWEARKLFSELLDVDPDQTIVGGNSSLQLMYITLVMKMFTGDRPWSKSNQSIKFIAPSPGYDRHWTMLEHLGIELIPVELTGNGPDMERVKELVKDENVKGIFCVPKYGNPSGEIYSDQVIKDLASMESAADDFTIMWDNAYAVHHLTTNTNEIPSIVDESIKAGNDNRAFVYVSTSKITFPGAGVAAVGSSEQNIKDLAKELGAQILSFDKINQKRHVNFLKNKDNILNFMEKHAELISPKFKTIDEKLENYFGKNNNFVDWSDPEGGYFIHVTTHEPIAQEVVEMMGELGVTLTPANASYPYGDNPKDNSIRLAPTFANSEEIAQAMDAFNKVVHLKTLEKREEN